MTSLEKAINLGYLFITEVWWMRYNVARNPIGTVPNAPLVSATGKELHPQMLSMIAIN